jgi:hypothetical protein
MIENHELGSADEFVLGECPSSNDTTRIMLTSTDQQTCDHFSEGRSFFEVRDGESLGPFSFAYNYPREIYDNPVILDKSTQTPGRNTGQSFIGTSVTIALSTFNNIFVI